MNTLEKYEYEQGYYDDHEQELIEKEKDKQFKKAMEEASPLLKTAFALSKLNSTGTL